MIFFAIQLGEEQRREGPERVGVVRRREDVQDVVLPGPAEKAANIQDESRDGPEVLDLPEPAGQVRIDGLKGHLQGRIAAQAFH